MNIKKEAYDKIIAHLRKQIGDVDSEIRCNKRDFKDLAYKQTILKRQRTKLVELINIVECDKPKSILR